MNKKHFKIKFITFSLKKNLLSILFVLFTISLVIFSKDNLSAAKNGLKLWANNVVPALLPFFIATELLGYTNVISALGKLLNKLMRPIFNVPGEGSFALLMGIISGYPIGAKIVTKFREEGTCTKEECERLLAFTNNSGPLFILGTVGISLFADTTTGIVLLFTHILACLSVGIIFRFWKRNTHTPIYSNGTITTQSTKKATFSNLGEILGNSIKSSISTVLMIGGFVVLFSVVISILEQSHIIHFSANVLTPILHSFGISSEFSIPLVNGMLELTNGVKQIAGIACRSLSTNVVLCSFLLGFGGISVLLQVFSIVSKTDISIFPYFLGKLLQGSLAALYTYLILHQFSFLSLDFAPVFANQTQAIAGYFNLSYLLFFLAILLIFSNCIKHYKKKKI